MLEIKNIHKSYTVGENVTHALKGVSLAFRKNEFVSILGQSGCGKTTMLNVLGGLDNYDSGDLIINSKSTKTYKDANWDAYRSRYVGFVFQSYNLIMHLSVLENVELALSIAGKSKEERRQKASKALQDVGLGDQLHKKPNQLSGGQMQRVAIARAIVNDPQIVLADEPTGALDTDTSVQILNILKELSKTKLVIMVTHNQDLAEKYSSRIVKMIDGEIVSDSNPLKQKEEIKSATKQENKKKDKKPSMSFWTGVSLSFRNLLTKKTRTFLTAFAGSIGIIGIALILSLSTGFQNYIERTEQETMASYPITIEETSVNLMASFGTFGQEDEIPVAEGDEIFVDSVIEDFLTSQSASVHTNNLEALKLYIDQNIDAQQINSVQYVYDVNLNIYDDDYQNQITKLNPIELGANAMVIPSLTAMFSQLDTWSELISSQEILELQYDLVGDSSWATNENQVVLMLDENGQVNDFILYALGLWDVSDIDLYLDYMLGITQTPPQTNNQTQYEPEDFLGLEYEFLPEAEYFYFDSQSGTYKDIRDIQFSDSATFTTYMQNKLANAQKLEVVGVAKPKEGANLSSSFSYIGYTHDLIENLITTNNSSAAALAQMADETLNIFTNQPFGGGESYEINIQTLGVADLAKPSEIRIYPLDFESKDYIVTFIDEYNALQQDSENQIQYTDFVGMLISSISVIVNAISYVLIAFVSISLVVSSIMIGIITYVSVLERTKEIGILRSVGARKKDVSNVFNAETLIMGFVSGSFGILVTSLLIIPTNIILENIIDISGVASLPVIPAIALILISMILTFVAGLIPARIAAKKDPVKALRED